MYKENVRLSEALQLHVTSEEKLKKTVNHLQAVTGDYQSEKDLHDVLVQEKIIEAKRQKNHIKKVGSKGLSNKRIILESSAFFWTWQKNLVQVARFRFGILQI